MTVEPYDEPEIDSGDVIIRRIDPVFHVVWDENRNRNRISSKAYNKSSGLTQGMSVDIEKLIKSDGIDPRIFVTTPKFTGSVSFSAASVRTLGLWVGYEPILHQPNVPDNPYHGEVWTPMPRKSFSEGQKTGLANSAQWYVEIPDVDIC